MILMRLLNGLSNLVLQASHLYVQGQEKMSGHYCTPFVNTARMLAAPIKSLWTICDGTNILILYVL